MKKYFLLLLLSIFAISCSKKIEVSGKVTGGSPLERIEFIDASGVANLPLVNLGVDKDGNFKGTFEAPRSGMYVMSYAGRQGLIYLKQGQSAHITGNANTFPAEFKVDGDAKANNEFLLQTQKFMQNYTTKLNIQETMGKDEPAFLKDVQRIQNDLEKNIDEAGKKTNADSKLIEWKKNDVRSGILTLLPQYTMFKKQISGNPAFAATKNLTDYENSLQKDKDQLVKDHPSYRAYVLGKMSDDFQKFAQKKSNGKANITTTELFADYLNTQKDYSQITKDYLLAFVMGQSDLTPNSSKETNAKIEKIIDENIKDGGIKNDLKKLQFVMNGIKINEKAPEASLITADGKSYSLSGNNAKPKVLMFYSSWTPYIQDNAVPVLKEVVNFYKSKLDFVFINFDDTKEQFSKTSSSLLKTIPGTNVYAEGGLNSDFAKKYGIYGFKLAPSYLILDKEGKVAGRTFFNLGDPEMVALLDKISGLKAPQVEATLQNDLLTPEKFDHADDHNQGQTPPPPPAPAPAKK